ncbi:MAG: GlcG/HbpS family heme-binding protein [Betaproteobacteria bacterium]
MKRCWLTGLLGFLLSATSIASAQDGTYGVRLLTPETALKAANSALVKCRADGYQVAVAVVDRSGIPQVMLRDRFAGPHTPDMAISKAWTAVTFRTDTSRLAEETQAGKQMSGIRHRHGVVAVGGGRVIEGKGSLLGGIGVSGAPGGDRDDACASAGISAIQEAIEF